MKHLVYLLLAALCQIGCGGKCQHVADLEMAHEQIAQLQADLSTAQARTDAGKVLVHDVFFKIKPDLTEADHADMVAKLQSLDQCESALKVWVGKPAATGDPRLVTDYQVALQVTFASEADLASYQQDPHHLKMREEASKYFAAPPVVYDFWAE